jgi:hypothetical protein
MLVTMTAASNLHRDWYMVRLQKIFRILEHHKLGTYFYKVVRKRKAVPVLN